MALRALLLTVLVADQCTADVALTAPIYASTGIGRSDLVVSATRCNTNNCNFASAPSPSSSASMRALPSTLALAAAAAAAALVM